MNAQDDDGRRIFLVCWHGVPWTFHYSAAECRADIDKRTALLDKEGQDAYTVECWTATNGRIPPPLGVVT